MNKETFITIITPIFNGERYIERYFEKIRELTHKNLQIVIVNDGSTDQTAEIVAKHAESDSRIFLINKKINEGVSAARNDALEKVQGNWIFFFDCDDTFEPTIISDCLAKVKCPTDTVCYNYASIRKNGCVVPHAFSYEEGRFTKNRIEKDILPHSFGTSMSELIEYLCGKRTIHQGKELNGPWRIMYSTQIIKREQLRFDSKLRVGEDTIFTNEYLALADDVIALDKILYYLHNNENSAIDIYNRNAIKMIDGKILLIKEKKALTARLLAKCIDTGNLWGGEYILSSIQVGWILAGSESMSYGQKVEQLKRYHDAPIVKERWNDLSVSEIVSCKSIKAVPILLLKLRMIQITELLLCLLRKIGYSLG